MIKKEKFRLMLPIVVPSIFMFACSILAVELLLRNLGAILSLFLPSDENAKFNFPLIFEQIRDANLSLHWILPLIFSCAFGLLLYFVIKKIKKKLITGIIILFSSVVFFMLAFLSSLMLTYVNGIRFCDLLSKLIPLIDKL